MVRDGGEQDAVSGPADVPRRRGVEIARLGLGVTVLLFVTSAVLVTTGLLCPCDLDTGLGIVLLGAIAFVASALIALGSLWVIAMHG